MIRQLTSLVLPILLLLMRDIGFVLVLATILAVGCARHKAGSSAAASAGASSGRTQQNSKLIVTPENGLVGKIVRVNSSARFVVLNFPIGHLPMLEQRLQVYRRGLKVGEVKVTGPQLDDNVVADLLAGEAAEGDQVRDQ